MHRHSTVFRTCILTTVVVVGCLALQGFAQNADSISPLPRPTQMHAIYSETADAKAEITDALTKAEAENKRVILVFGGNWCFDCHVLDAAFHDPKIQPLVDQNFEVVHVDVGQFDKNLDIAKKYKVNIKGGVPALAVLGGKGQVLFSDKGGEFEAARRMTRADIVNFLQKWKPASKS